MIATGCMHPARTILASRAVVWHSTIKIVLAHHQALDEATDKTDLRQVDRRHLQYSMSLRITVILGILREMVAIFLR